MCQYHGRVLSCEEIYEVLRCAKCTRLAVCGSGHPYIVPMNYTWDCVNGRLHFFLTSCGCGEKVRCLRKNNKVALEFEVAGENGCMCTVVAKGTVVDMGRVGGATDNTCGCGCNGCNGWNNGCGCNGCGCNGCGCNGCNGCNGNNGCGCNNGCNCVSCYCCRYPNGCVCCYCPGNGVGGDSDTGRLSIEIRTDSISGRAFSNCCNG